MPMITSCPVCKGGAVNHGFGYTVAGIFTAYHGENGSFCRWFETGDRQIFTDELAAFRHQINTFPRWKENKIWVAAWLAKLTGHPRKAKRLFEKWNAEN